MPRIHHQARWIVPAFAIAALGWGYAGRAQDPGAGQKVGAKVDQAIQDIKGGLRQAGKATKEQFAKAKTAVNDMGIESRVYGRIHWDRALNDAAIELNSDDDGVLTLDGTVASAQAKAHAVKLASETVGVAKVVDRLAVRPATTTTPAKP